MLLRGGHELISCLFDFSFDLLNVKLVLVLNLDVLIDVVRFRRLNVAQLQQRLLDCHLAMMTCHSFDRQSFLFCPEVEQFCLLNF